MRAALVFLPRDKCQHSRQAEPQFRNWSARMRPAHLITSALALVLASGLALSPTGARASGSGGTGGSSTAPSASVPSYDPAVEYRKGIEAMTAKQYKAAERAFQRVVDVAPKDANTRYLLGMAKAGNGDLAGARKAYARAVKLDTNLVEARRDLALAAFKLGDSAAAQTELASLKAQAAACAGTCANDLRLRTAISAVETELAGKPADAAPAPTPSALLAPETGDAAYLTAVSLINEHRYDEALEALSDAARVFAAHPDILTYQGFANRKLGRLDRAESFYQRALAIAPNHRGALEYFGELKVERGDLTGARAMLAKLESVCTFGCAEADELRGWIDRAPS